MKRFNALCLFVAAVILTMTALVSCQSLSDFKQAVNGANTGAQDLKKEVHAATQPQTLPDGTVIAPSTMPAKVVKGVDKLAENTAKGAAVVNSIPDNATSDPGAFVRAIAPFTGNYAGLTYLVGLGITGVFAAIKNQKAKQADAALQSTADAISLAAVNKHITVTPDAVTAINAVVTDHPGTSKIIDALSDAANTPRIPN